MNSTLESIGGPAVRNRPLAFTLIELPIFLVVIAVLFGLLLPAVQRARETHNETATKTDLAQILAAEKTYFQAHAMYANSLSLLGLQSKFPNDSLDGYIYSITVSNTVCTITALPVNPGLNGSVDFTMDQTGKLYESPDPNALSQHELTTEDIENSAMQVMAQAITVTDTTQTYISTITHAFMVPGTVGKAFLQVAPNGRLTVSDILNYSGLGSAEMAPLITAIQDDFQFGTGGEDTTKITLTLPEVFEIDTFSFGVGSVLNITQGSSGAPSAGKITFNEFTFGGDRGGLSLNLRDPELFTTVTLNTPPGNGTGFVYSGPLTITDVSGNLTGGFVIGELLPAVQAGAKGAAGDQHFKALVIALNGTTVMTGGAGWGAMTLGFTAIGDPVTGSLLVVPY
jgi:type II secretory pathway pseudopilin PulG